MHSYTISTKTPRQEFKIVFGCIGHSRPTWATWDPDSKISNNNNSPQTNNTAQSIRTNTAHLKTHTFESLSMFPCLLKVQVNFLSQGIPQITAKWNSSCQSEYVNLALSHGTCFFYCPYVATALHSQPHVCTVAHTCAHAAMYTELLQVQSYWAIDSWKPISL